MNKILLGLLSILLLVSGCNTNTSFSLKGKFTGEIKQNLLVALVDKEGHHVIDTLELNNGEIDYKLTLDQPVIMVIGFKGSRQQIGFFADNTAYTIKGDVANFTEATVTGGKLFSEYDRIQKLDDEFNVLLQELRVAYNEAGDAGDEAKMKEIDQTYDDAYAMNTDQKIKFITENPSSPVAAYVVYRNYRNRSLSDIKEVFGKLDSSLAVSPYYQLMNERIAKLETVDVRKMAPEITLDDVDGNSFSLSSLRGKIVLIDFWASWCEPCRRENPNVVKIYNEFKDKGFDILGVSLDQRHEFWLTAIEQDHLTWNHVSDLKGWKSEAADDYAVSSIPHTVLIDAEGTIIAKNLRGEELRTKIAELLN